jgi:nucleotide-binding universal stress UspA family protein
MEHESSLVRSRENDKEGLMSATRTKPILACYDGSEGARHAIETAATLFPGHRAIVLYAWSPISVIVAAYGGAIALPSYDDDALKVEASKVAAEGCKLANDAGLKAQPEIAEVTHQGIWHTIRGAADQCDAELIVLGARGLSTFKSMVLGSVSHSVTQHAHLPVLIVPPALHEEKTTEAAEHEAAGVR